MPLGFAALFGLLVHSVMQAYSVGRSGRAQAQIRNGVDNVTHCYGLCFGFSLKQISWILDLISRIGNKGQASASSGHM